MFVANIGTKNSQINTFIVFMIQDLYVKQSTFYRLLFYSSCNISYSSPLEIILISLNMPVLNGLIEDIKAK